MFEKKFFLVIFSLILINTSIRSIFVNANLSANFNKLLYNTTSGLYEAKLVKLEGFGFEKPKYLHKLISVHYGEKPERFKQSVLRKYRTDLPKVREPLSCYQSLNLTSYGLFNVHDPPLMTEDCLTINLYIPAPSSPEEENELKNMSVIVHIHGGSNMVGGSGLFDGSILASRGRIIVAIINYRLSILGFLSDMTPKYPGNYGLKDQILAIKWLKMNCHVLNCNPNAITLWGHSAGAGDVNWLAISPLSNHLFQRVIIQSGSSFSYWGFDKTPFERYRSLKKYFNCTNLPDYHTKENKAMTQLIEICLSNVTLEDLFTFKFALIDAPGPTYDGFLGSDAIINEHSPKDMVDKAENMANLDILTGINGLEGFSFEGYFSSSVKFFTQNNLTNEVVLTMERFSLLTREKCKQNSVIENRIKLDNFYEDKIKKYIVKESSLQSEEANRLKAIFANSDAIFDTGFIELLTVIANKKQELRRNGINKSNLFVYEYLHENSGSQSNLKSFKEHIKNYPMSTHFDGIDLVFGLPVAHKNSKLKHTCYDWPYSNFAFDNEFSDEEANLSLILMTYYSNFVKTGDPNNGDKIETKWEPYTNNKAYLRLDGDLIKHQLNKTSKKNLTYGIRDDLYDFWFVEMDKNGKCNSLDLFNNTYISKNHTKGNNPALDKCFELLNNSEEYNHLSEMFLIEYEYCMNTVEHNASLRNLFNTICLDVIAIRRLLIEYELCCINNQTIVHSTICSLKNFNKKFVGHNITSLIQFSIKSVALENNSNGSFKLFNKAHSNYNVLIKYFCCFLLLKYFKNQF